MPSASSGPVSSAQATLVHSVYFTLKDGSPAAQAKLIADLRKLAEIPGLIYFAVGTVVPDLARPVNVRDFHVGLSSVFTSRKAHDDYQIDPRHQRFIAENKDSWLQARVFDCNVPADSV